jgi:hypothetical protein
MRAFAMRGPAKRGGVSYGKKAQETLIRRRGYLFER